MLLGSASWVEAETDWSPAQRQSAMAQFGKVVLSPSIRPSDIGVDEATLKRMMAASVPLLTYDAAPRMLVNYYDPLSRCALVVSYDVGGGAAGARLVRPVPTPITPTAVKIRLATQLDLMVLQDRTRLPADGRCAADIAAFYGPSFARSKRDYSSLSAYAVNILANGEEARPAPDLPPQRMQIFKEARARATGFFSAPVFLGALHDGPRVLVMVGDAYSSARWLAEYSSLDGHSWTLRGATDVGVTR
jgi:hypothetical protein